MKPPACESPATIRIIAILVTFTIKMEFVKSMENNRRKNLLEPRTHARTGKTLYPSEHLEQVFAVSWFRREYPGVLIFAIPNGGHRGKAEAARLKAEGVTPGVPDLFVPAWRLWIEMKRQKGGRLSKQQKEVIEYLKSIGDAVLVCNGAEEAIEQITKWSEQNVE
jgi:hypothetical protein